MNLIVFKLLQEGVIITDEIWRGSEVTQKRQEQQLESIAQQ